ncbi:phage integrase SAM-like domain-containing protein [Rhodobacteraceae bacterium N5(2021)]|nr:phage integrase SAM-like domain-containing protein [Gymnodinialimonas phycosphaerae]MBY4893322.1 phage integrase SAM-like domain-containing protein [Gymnodinialimonas phycosphaerae]
MDHRKAEKDLMRYLVQPRGPGKSWVFRMATPLALVGVPNPWDGKPLAKEIKRGLGTRHLPEARTRRDVVLADIRRLQVSLSDGEAFSLASAVQWRETILTDQAEAQAQGDGHNVGSEFVLADKLEQAEAAGFPRDQLKRFARVATGKGFPLDLAHAQYVKARRPANPYGYAPLKRATVANLDTAMKHLRAFLHDEAKTACMEDLTPELAQRFRDEYLPSVPNNRNPRGLSAQTVAKNVNLLKQVWVWAIGEGHLGRKARNPWEFRKGLRRTVNKREKVREDYQPHEFSALLKATTRGSREGDILRLAIASGYRADELATLSIDEVKADGSGFSLAQGKTSNAKRFIPLVDDAKELRQPVWRLTAHRVGYSSNGPSGLPQGRLLPSLSGSPAFAAKCWDLRPMDASLSIPPVTLG